MSIVSEILEGKDVRKVVEKYCVREASTTHQSNLSFDFSWSGDTYNLHDVEKVAEEALKPFECVGSDFESMTDQYAKYDTMYENVTQCSVTFVWSDGALENPGQFTKAVEKRLEKGLSDLGMNLEGLDFQAID